MKLSKSYEPNLYETDIYDLWEQSDSFKPSGKGEPFCIVMPPPNANASLHVGFALVNALEDIATRYQRLQGRAALFLPGADHAGFETWVVYEKQLAKQGKSRFDFNREELYKQVWDFVKLNRTNFETQIRRLGASCDWSRFTFTLDQKVVDTVYSTFKKMWDDKLIYRGERLVNYCTYHGTAFADIEVQYKEVEGHLWTIKYPIADSHEYIQVATTRPETMLGDTAIAVNPKDTRYKQYIGKTVKVPLTNREIPILADDMVDPVFGTGAVKITPAHDPNDFEVAERHDLPRIQVINHEGSITHEMPNAYRGKPFLEARELVIKDLKKAKLLAKTESYTHSVGHCYKCGNVIQPLIRDQWFVDMKSLAKRAISVLEQNQIKFYPQAKSGQLIDYLHNLRDWNISRQIAWGIPIPAFQNVDNPEDWIFDTHVAQEIIEVGGQSYRRDPDVFDTWFSSGQWPYATLSYPDGNDFKQFYPLSLMETGGEILYPWVSRMIMLGLYITDEVPFKEVYIHGYVMAEDGSKMSKSVGNTIDPMKIIDQYGSDALRMGIISGRAAGVNQPFDHTKFIAARNFCNKLWNIARFCEGVLGENPIKNSTPEPSSIADHWVLSKLQRYTDKISTDLDNYRFSEAYESLYHFVWDDVADWYIEASKQALNRDLLALLLESILKLAHPFAPFVTETIWQTLYPNKTNLLIGQKWPQNLPKFDNGQAGAFDEIMAVVSEVRNVSTSLSLNKPTLLFTGPGLLADNSKLLIGLAHLKSASQTKAGQGMRLTNTKLKCWLDVDLQTAKNYLDKIQTNRQLKQASVAMLKNRLKNKAYTKNAPAHIVAQTQQQLVSEQELLAKLEQELASFSAAAKNIT